MDATDLQFPDNSFQNVTFLLINVYEREDAKKAIQEAGRVLKQGGMGYIWDADICMAYPEPFVIDLDIFSAKNSIQTSYGIVKDEAQDADTIIQYIKDVGLSIRSFEK